MKHPYIHITAFLAGTFASIASAEVLYQATFEIPDNTEGWTTADDGSTVFQTSDFGGAGGSAGALAVQVRDGWLWFARNLSDIEEPSYNEQLHNAIATIYSGDPSQYQLSFEMLHDVDTMAKKLPTYLKFNAVFNGPDGWKQFDATNEYEILGQQVINSKGKEWITVSFNMSLFPGITPNGKWIQPHLGLASNWGADSYFLVDNIRLEKVEAVQTWAGWEKVDDNVDTSPWMGWLYVGNGDWVWSYSLNSYIFLPESYVTESGAWTYVPAK